MSATLKNTLISGLAVLAVFEAFSFSQVQDRQVAITEAQGTPLSALLENPAKYDSLDVSIAAVLLWHPDEPVVFVDNQSLQEMNFRKSILIEMASDVDFGFADRKSVLVSGKFFFDIDFAGRMQGYKGIFRARSIVVADN